MDESDEGQSCDESNEGQGCNEGHEGQGCGRASQGASNEGDEGQGCNESDEGQGCDEGHEGVKNWTYDGRLTGYGRRSDDEGGEGKTSSDQGKVIRGGKSCCFLFTVLICTAYRASACCWGSCCSFRRVTR